MGFITLDDDFADHPKVCDARAMDRGAVDLYICGLSYCRKNFTGGFIPAHKVNTLGVSSPRKAVEALLKFALWDHADGGFQIHDYVSWYPNDAAQKAAKAERREKNRAAGRKGGQVSSARRSQALDAANAGASSGAFAIPNASPNAEASAQPLIGGGGGGGVGALEKKKSVVVIAPWFQQLCEEYPQHRVTRDFMTQSSFEEQLTSFEGGPHEAWFIMLGNLRLNIQSHEWRVKGMAPKLLKYLREGLWRNVFPAEPPDQLLSEKSARTATSASRFIREG